MTSVNQNPTIGKSFVPYQAFKGDYLSVLNNLFQRELITYSEKEMLRILNKFSFKDGECYPSHKRLESEIGLKNGQVRNILRSLESKGLIEVQRPNPLQRHLFRKHNRYFFLWNIAYFEYVENTEKKSTDTENAPQTDTELYNISPQVPKSKKPALPVLSARADVPAAPTTAKEDVPVSLSAPIKPYLAEIQSLGKDIDRQAKSAGKRFDSARFTGSCLKRSIHPQAIIDALVNLKKNLPAVESPWGYAEHILQIRSGNYHERDHQRAAQSLKNETAANPAMSGFLNFCLKSI